jgi:hypothetical protein
VPVNTEGSSSRRKHEQTVAVGRVNYQDRSRASGCSDSDNVVSRFELYTDTKYISS